MSEVPMMAILRFDDLAVDLKPGRQVIRASTLDGDPLLLRDADIKKLELQERSVFLHLNWDVDHWVVVNMHQIHKDPSTETL